MFSLFVNCFLVAVVVLDEGREGRRLFRVPVASILPDERTVFAHSGWSSGQERETEKTKNVNKRTNKQKIGRTNQQNSETAATKNCFSYNSWKKWRDSKKLKRYKRGSKSNGWFLDLEQASVFWAQSELLTSSLKRLLEAAYALKPFLCWTSFLKKSWTRAFGWPRPK